MTDKIEHRPLLGVGFHELNLEEIETQFVSAFPDSVSRKQCFTGLKAVVEQRNSANVQSNLWINGSFVTEKVDIGDVDLLLVLPEVSLQPSNLRFRRVLHWLITNAKADHLCDAHILIQYSKPSSGVGARPYWASIWQHAYWLRLFGYSRSEEIKGIVILKVGDNSESFSVP